MCVCVLRVSTRVCLVACVRYLIHVHTLTRRTRAFSRRLPPHACDNHHTLHAHAATWRKCLIEPEDRSSVQGHTVHAPWDVTSKTVERPHPP
eukprot:6118841-Prymnesium_polylepis.1